MRKLTKTRSRKSGLPPGTIVPLGEGAAGRPRITVIDYDADNLFEKELPSAQACFEFRDRPTVTWINVDGVADAATIAALGDHFGLHPLVQEDIASTDQRPKIEDFEKYIYVVLKMLQWNAERDEMDIEQVSVILGGNFVLSFQERPGDLFEPVRNRIRNSKGRVRAMGADYLAYSILDAIVDGYFAILEQLGNKIEVLEDALLARPEPATLGQLHRLKREAMFIRRSVWPLREVINSLARGETPLVTVAVQPFLRDVYDHTIQVIDTMETFRDMLAGMLDTYLSSLSNRMNEVMKVLTIIATIFIPITFIAGVYGMNFQHMPELAWRWGYPIVWCVMVAVAVVMLVYFRRRRWI